MTYVFGLLAILKSMKDVNLTTMVINVFVGLFLFFFKNKIEVLEKEIENLRQKSVIKEDYHRELDRFFKEVFRRLDRLEAYYVGQNQSKKR